MATYQYVARGPDGAETAGMMQADSEVAVLRTLDERSLFPVRVTEQRAARSGRAGGRVAMRDVSVVYGQLADLLNAGVPILRALETLIRAVANRRLAAVMAGVRDDVSEGKALAEAMTARPHVFPALHVALVRAGERGGFLEDVLTNLAEYLERVDELRSKVRGALIYPCVLTLIGVMAVLIILLWLVPQFKGMFTSMVLPAPTRVLFAISDMLLYQWHVVLGVLVLVVLGVAGLIRSSVGRRWWDRAQLKLPLVGTLLRSVAIARFCRILGTLLHNGVPLLQSLDIAKDAAGSTLLAESIAQATESVRGGDPLAGPLGRSKLFPADIVEMIAIAEESNQMEKVLIQIAQTVERRTNRKVETVVRLIEPLILVVIATMIGFVAMGLMYPIFKMSQMLK